MKNQDYIDDLLGKFFAQEELNKEERKELEVWINSNSEEFQKLKHIMAHTEIEKNRITTHLDLNRMEEVIQELAELCQCQYQKTDEQNYRLFSK